MRTYCGATTIDLPERSCLKSPGHKGPHRDINFRTWFDLEEGDETKVRCCRFLGSGPCPGYLQFWWGTDGHNGRERFSTCDHCGATS